MEGIVIAVAEDRATFAVETHDGICAVFCQHAGPLVQVGDILSGSVTSRGTQVLTHPDGRCAAVGDSGPVSRGEALALLGGGHAFSEAPDGQAGAAGQA